MRVQADPYQLRYMASCFSDGANNLNQKAKWVEAILNDLVNDQNGWQGEAA